MPVRVRERERGIAGHCGAFRSREDMGGEVSSLPLSAPCPEVNRSIRCSHAHDCLPPAHGTGRADCPMGESLAAIGTVVLTMLHIRNFDGKPYGCCSFFGSF